MPALMYYKEAQKLGQKEFRAAMSKGEYPYLPVLDDFVPDDRINRGKDMGTTHIPMGFIVGTRTSGRTTAFARNFMPLMGENTEFAAKWDHLCQSQMEEGIREPIQVYEYMNRYYVQEGNKRVSVLRYVGAETVYAHVIRVLPEENDSWELVCYNALTEFMGCSGVNYIEFSRPWSYDRLQQLVGKKPGESWTEEERREFSSVHYHFRKAYEALGGKKLNTTVGDAMLAFMEVYGYGALRNNIEDKIKEMLSKIWEEIELQQEEVPVDLKFDPEKKTPNLLTQMLTLGEKKEKKVAFIHVDGEESAGMTQTHEFGRLYAQRVLGDAIQTKAYFNAMTSDPVQVIEQAVEEGNTIVFLTSSQLEQAGLRSAAAHPNVTFFLCTPLSHHRLLRSYYARMYEAKFVIGAIAGALAGSDKIGYVAFHAGTESATHRAAQLCRINAFALGAQMVNPRATVYLEWFGNEGPTDAIKRLTDQGIRLISSQDVPTKWGENRTFGLNLFTDGKGMNLASPVLHWGIYYEILLRMFLDKSLQTEYEESNKALSYFWGMSSGVVGVHCSERLPDSTKNLAELLQSNIKAGLSHPFKGKIYSQNSREMDGELTMEQIMWMNWLAENVEGEIPKLEEIQDKKE